MGRTIEPINQAFASAGAAQHERPSSAPNKANNNNNKGMGL
jgi:hypothetical protein